MYLRLHASAYAVYIQTGVAMKPYYLELNLFLSLQNVLELVPTQQALNYPQVVVVVAVAVVVMLVASTNTSSKSYREVNRIHQPPCR